MSIATNQNLSRMISSPVLIAARGKRVIGWSFIGENACARQYPLLDKRDECFGFGVRNHFSDYRTLSLKHSGDDGFANGTPSLNPSRSNVLVHVLGFAAKETFVGFTFAAKRIMIFFEHLANLFEHPPRGFVGN